MSDPFIGEIKIFAGNFAPHGWAFCNGQIMRIVQNTALYSILGTTYGGDGKTTFALPNLQGRAAIQQIPNSPDYALGESGGAETATLNANQIPGHLHPVRASTSGGTHTDPAEMVWAAAGKSRGFKMYTADTTQLVQMNSGALAPFGNSQETSPSHNNMMPYLALNFVIALQGLYPSKD